ncbi:MAG: PilN domain-containing protein [Gallionellaceae bacterium]|nr:PilN domain-containing protein [Gallionellaceae bacterium]
MSPSWREQIAVAICPDRIELLHMRRGGRRARLGQVVPCPAATADEANWAPALRTLQAALPACARSGAEVTLVLSNHFVRYQLLPWSDKLGSEAEELAYGRFGFSQVYGAAAGGWTIRLSGQGGDEPWLASAVDSELVAGLERAVAAAGLRLRSIQPWLMAACNGRRGQLAGKPAWFALAEPGRVCLALLRKGRWRELACFALAADGLAELPGLLERQQLLADVADAPGRVDVLATVDAAEARPDAPALHWLSPASIRGLAADQARHFQMAWHGLAHAMGGVSLDYRSRDAGPGRMSWAALLLAGAASALLLVHYQQLSTEAAARQDELNRLASASGQHARNPAEARQLSVELDQARVVTRQLGFPWASLFTAVEASANDEIALLAVEPELKRGQIGIVGEAKSYVAVLAYIRRLQTTDVLGRVYLQNHQVQTQDREHPVRFTLAAVWRGR